MTDQKYPKTLTGFRKSPLAVVLKSVIAGSLIAAIAPVQAANWQLDNGVQIDLDTQLAYAAQWRVEEQDATLLTETFPEGHPLAGTPVNKLMSINADDGNRSFEDGDMTQNRFSISSDLDIAYSGDSFSGGVFVRARGFYDDTYSGNSANNSAATCNRGLTTVTADNVIGPIPGLEQVNIIVGPGDCSSFDNNKGIEDYHESRVELLDAFVYVNIDIFEQSASLRAGDQVVSWGESLALYGGISSAQGPLDVSKANVPGVELKDIFMPVGQVYVETSITDNFSIGAYYQYDWQRSRIDSPGTYMSPVDIIGEGVESLIIPTPLGISLDVPVVRDEPDEGQWGIALRYLAEELNSTEFGFYYLNYNDTLPGFQLAAVNVPGLGALPTQLNLEYFEDIDLVGASFGTVLGDTNVSGEVSYRDGAPVQIKMAGYHFAPAETVQAQVSVLHIFAQNALADNLSFMGEIGYNRVLDIDETPVTQALGIDVGDVSGALDNDRGAAGYIVKFIADYYNVASALDLKLSMSLKHDFNGTSSTLFTFTEDKMDLGFGADFTYLSDHAFGLKYVAFLTDTDEIVKDGKPLEFGHQLADRDNVSVYYKYSF